MPNQRISELPKIGPLFSSGTSFNYESSPPPYSQLNDERYFMVINPKISNEIISFSGLYNSTLAEAMHLRGDQTLSGKKNFNDEVHINRRLSINSIGSISTGENISGINFQSKTGYFRELNIKTAEEKSYCNTLDIHCRENLVVNNEDLSSTNSLQCDRINITDNASLKTLNSNNNIYALDDLNISGGQISIKESIFYTDSELNFISTEGLISESRILNAQIIGNGSDYSFSGDIQGEDPTITLYIDDILTIYNAGQGHTLEIKDSSNNIVATESNEGRTLFSSTETGSYSYYCTSHPNSMSGIINVQNNTGVLGSNLIFKDSFNELLNLSNTGLCNIQNHIRIAESPILGNGINSGEISFSGESFIPSVQHSSGQFIGGNEESVAFTSYLNSGEKSFTISFPKTFKSVPVISTSAENCFKNQTGINNYKIYGLDQYSYEIEFESNIDNNESKLHTIVMGDSDSIFASKKKSIYRFSNSFNAQGERYEINFPEEYENVKISATLENIDIEDKFLISGVNSTGYTLYFDNAPQNNFTVHTIATQKQNQRIS
jgi:hypothetical protein